MANRSYFESEEAWKLATTLEAIDPTLETFAQAHRLTLSRNSKGHPERSLRWGDGPSCLIQIYLDGLTNPTWALWLCCHEDRDGSRYMRSQFLLENVELVVIERDLPALLKNGRGILNDWRTRPSDLVFATHLASR